MRRRCRRITPNPNHTSAPNSAVMIVYHHSGQVKVQNRNWNLTLSVFWMMKTGGPRGRSATRPPRHSVCARPAVAHPVEPPSRPPHVLVDGRFRSWIPLLEQSNWGGLSAPAVLGTEEPKRIERHAQSPPKYHPNRPECSTATERPDANQKQVDDHVGEEDAVERLPGRPRRSFLCRRCGRRQRRHQSRQVGHGRIEVAEGRGRVDLLGAFGKFFRGQPTGLVVASK